MYNTKRNNLNSLHSVSQVHIYETSPLPLFFHSACPVTVPSASRTFSNSYITKTLAVLSGHQHCRLLIWMSYYNAQSLCVFISKMNVIISRVSQWNGNVIDRKIESFSGKW